MVALAAGCVEAGGGAPELSRERGRPRLELGEARPATAERSASGSIRSRITRGSTRFSELVRCACTGIEFKDEEGTGADRLMTPALRARLRQLERLVAFEWPGVHLRVTEAWDEQGEHDGESLHYEGRAADLTTSDRDPKKLGRLGGLAVDAGFAWVYREATHVHVSVR